MAVPSVEAVVAVQPSPSPELGEGTIWDARTGKLLWLDIMGCRLFRFDPSTGQNEEHDMSAHSANVSSVVPLSARDDATGNKVGLTVREGFATYDYGTREFALMPGNPPVADGERFNDGKVDPQGRYWAGTIARDPPTPDGAPVHRGFFYRRDADGSVAQIFDGIAISNGLTWAKDGQTMYYTDTPTGQVDVLDFDAKTGAVSNRRPCVTGFVFEETGFPDGCCLDSEGMLWVARFNGGCAGCYDPRSGELLCEARVPATAGKQVTSVAFGGDGLGDLFLTTAHEGVAAADLEAAGTPLAGALFRVPRAELAALGRAAGEPVGMLALA